MIWCRFRLYNVHLRVYHTSCMYVSRYRRRIGIYCISWLYIYTYQHTSTYIYVCMRMLEDIDMCTCNAYMFARVPSKLQMILLTRGLRSKGGQGSTCASRRHGTWVFSKLVTVLSSLFPIQFPRNLCCELWIERDSILLVYRPAKRTSDWQERMMLISPPNLSFL